MNLEYTDQLPRNLARTVICMSGFGDKNEVVAIYVDGKLFSTQETRFRDDDDDCYLPLARKLARQLGYKWLQRHAACVWGQHSFETPPGKLDRYEARTRALFSKISLADVLDNESFTPPSRQNEGDEEWRLQQMYVLCGGEPRQGEAWVRSFIESQGGGFVKQNEAAYFRCEVRDHDEAARAQSMEVWAQLKAAWRERVLAVLQADKPRSRLGQSAPRWSEQAT